MLPASLEAASDATPPVINNNSQEEEQSRGDSSERWGIAQKFTSPMLFSGPEKPRKKSTDPARLTYGKPTGAPGAEKAGRALSDTGLRVTGETLGVKAANTEPALVTRSQGWRAGLGPPPYGPFLLASRQLKLCTEMYREQQAREKGSVRVMGAATPRGHLHDPLGTGCRAGQSGLH